MGLLRTVDRGLIISIEPIYYWLVASYYYKKSQLIKKDYGCGLVISMASLTERSSNFFS